MATVKMSVTEYMAHRAKYDNNITRQAVTKALREGYEMPGVKHYEMYGGTYVLHVSLKELNNYLVAINKPVKLRNK